MSVSKTNDKFQIKMKMPNSVQEPPLSSKSPYQDLKDIDVLCILKVKIESKIFDHKCIKDQWSYLNEDQGVKSQTELKRHRCSLHHQNQDSETKF